jgi:hypothetical protein
VKCIFGQNFIMEKKLLREVRMLRIYTAILTVILISITILSFTKTSPPRFEEIDVERINIIEKDGQLKMVISNKQRQHPGLISGKEIPPRERAAGMIFFNEAGDECGGLIYEGNEENSDMTYSIDQFRNDQIMQLNYSEQHKTGKPRRAYGLKLWDRSDNMQMERQVHLRDSLKALNDKAASEKVYQQLAAKGELGAERFFAGKTYDGEVGVFIRDTKGNPRIKIFIDAQNNPRLQFLDANGKSIPVK